MESVETETRTAAATQTKFTEVHIGGVVYKLKLGPEQEPAYLQQLGDLVDKKVSELKNVFSQADEQTILMLALLNFADELVKASAQTAPTANAVPSPQVQSSCAAGKEVDGGHVILTQNMLALKAQLKNLLAPSSNEN